MDADDGGGTRASARRGRERAREDTSPRDPERGALHRILREHLATFLSEREEAGAPLAKFVVDELRGYLDCGVLPRGCAHFKCDDCGADRVTGLSCKGRGFCPRCVGRRMTEGARDLVEKVFPHERVRQWVLSFPFALRWPLAFRHELMLAISRIAAQEIERRYRRLAKEAGLRKPRGGSVAVIQRFGSGCRLNPHLHTAHLDGAYGIDARGEERFFTAPAPSPPRATGSLRVVVTAEAEEQARGGPRADPARRAARLAAVGARRVRLGPFPAPFFSGSERLARRWSREHRARLVREDVVDLEHVTDLGRLELLALRLPELVGSPLSVNALSEDLDVAHRTLERWLSIFERLYAVHRVPSSTTHRWTWGCATWPGASLAFPHGR